MNIRLCNFTIQVFCGTSSWNRFILIFVTDDWSDWIWQSINFKVMCMGTATLAGSISALIIIIINLSIDNTRKYSRYYAVNWEHTTCAKCSFSFSMSNVLIIHKLIDIWILCREFCYFSFVIGNVRKEQKNK